VKETQNPCVPPHTQVLSDPPAVCQAGKGWEDVWKAPAQTDPCKEKHPVPLVFLMK